MFLLTADIKVEGYKAFKPHSSSWENGVDNYCNTATVKIPGIAYLLCNDTKKYDRVDAAQQFKEGSKIEVFAGYDGVNKSRFKGFIRRINFTVPVELECEGYSYQLRENKRITKNYKTGTTVKTILTDLIAGTAIKLFDSNPDITIETQVRFNNVSGTQVLDWIKEKLLQTVYFKNEVLYCGLRETANMRQVKYQLGWNVVQDNELKFSPIREYSEVNIHLAARNKDGTFKNSAIIKNGAVKYKRLNVNIDQATIDRTAEQERKILANVGYEGSITAFLEPMIETGDAANIYDKRYPQRTQTSFGDSVKGEIGPNGGRQKIKIGNILGTG